MVAELHGKAVVYELSVSIKGDEFDELCSCWLLKRIMFYEVRCWLCTPALIESVKPVNADTIRCLQFPSHILMA
jgi:hypothetical protein